MGCNEDTELSITVVGDRAIRIINREYLNRDKATNVISFSMREGEFGDINLSSLGDVIISADTAAKEAADAGIQFFERLVFLLMHGILHLCGYDHERCGEEKAIEMENKEKEIFKILKREKLLSLNGL